jgi:hypothetical protein
MGNTAPVATVTGASQGIGRAVAGMRPYRYSSVLRLLLWGALLQGAAAKAQGVLPAATPAQQLEAGQGEPGQVVVSAGATEEQLMAELRGVVTSWASAWQSQFDDVYLMHYHPDFKPDDFASRQDWIAQRRARIRAPGDITISLRDFSVVAHDDGTALVRFWLHYSRPGYADDTHKEMLLEKTGQIWQIKREHNIAVVKKAAP